MEPKNHDFKAIRRVGDREMKSIEKTIRERELKKYFRKHYQMKMPVFPKNEFLWDVITDMDIYNGNLAGYASQVLEYYKIGYTDSDLKDVWNLQARLDQFTPTTQLEKQSLREGKKYLNQLNKLKELLLFIKKERAHALI